MSTFFNLILYLCIPDKYVQEQYKDGQKSWSGIALVLHYLKPKSLNRELIKIWNNKVAKYKNFWNTLGIVGTSLGRNGSKDSSGVHKGWSERKRSTPLLARGGFSLPPNKRWISMVGNAQNSRMPGRAKCGRPKLRKSCFSNQMIVVYEVRQIMQYCIAKFWCGRLDALSF